MNGHLDGLGFGNFELKKSFLEKLRDEKLFILHGEFVLSFHVDSLSFEIGMANFTVKFIVYWCFCFLFLEILCLSGFVRLITAEYCRWLKLILREFDSGLLFFFHFNLLVCEDNTAEVLFCEFCFDLLNFLLSDGTLSCSIQEFHFLDLILKLLHIANLLVQVGFEFL